MVNGKKIRVLIAKPGLDGHDRGAKIIARAIRDAGMEVVYTGIRQTAEEIVETALQEDVKVVGLSMLSGGQVHHVAKVRKLLDEKGLDDILLIVGGIIPKEDVPRLKKQNVKGVFGPGTPMEEILNFIETNAGVT